MRWQGLLVGTCVAAGTVGAFEDSSAQEWFLDAAVVQSFTSAEPLESPRGFTVAAGGSRIWGPFGLQVSVRRLTEETGQVAQRCGFASCTPGPFDQSYALTTIGLGVSYELIDPSRTASLSLALTGASSVQVERLRHLQTGNRSEHDRIGSDATLGGSVQLRLRPLLGGLGPAASVRYDRIRGSPCIPDASCLPGRNVWEVSVGLRWTFASSSPDR